MGKYTGPVSRNFNCPMCPNTFASEEAVDAHIANFHAPPPPQPEDYVTPPQDDDE